MSGITILANGSRCAAKDPLNCKNHPHFGQGMTQAQMVEALWNGRAGIELSEFAYQAKKSAKSVEEMTREEIVEYHRKAQNRRRAAEIALSEMG